MQTGDLRLPRWLACQKPALQNGLRQAKCLWRTSRSPDRRLLVERILPTFAAQCPSILWIGVRRYTRSYPALLERDGAECWTLDLEPAVRRWGHPERHVVSDLLQLPGPLGGRRFAGVICNGVFGYGIDEPGPQAAALAAMSEVVEASGWLLLGWNRHRVEDPLRHRVVHERFRRAGFGDLRPREAVVGTTHVFDFLQRR